MRFKSDVGSAPDIRFEAHSYTDVRIGALREKMIIKKIFISLSLLVFIVMSLYSQEKISSVPKIFPSGVLRMISFTSETVPSSLHLRSVAVGKELPALTQFSGLLLFL